MTSLDVAQSATSSQLRAPVPVKNRERLWGGRTVEIRVPADARYGEFKDGETVLRFAKFARSVKGGMINFFVHADNPDEFYGRRIKAVAEIWRKDMEDGRSFLYVDLRPVVTGGQANLRLIVLSDLTSPAPKGAAVFETPRPLRGRIAIASMEKVDSEPPKSEPPKVRRSTGDSQLDRLLSHGWQITYDSDEAVGLAKGEGDKRRTMTHHRPKNKKKK